jgi:hypothetical protein
LTCVDQIDELSEHETSEDEVVEPGEWGNVSRSRRKIRGENSFQDRIRRDLHHKREEVSS